MSRADLLALTPESLAALTNPGLLKRAQKEMDAGQGPTVSEAPDGTVTGVFADGVTTTLPPHTALPAAACSCGAATACRHRVEVVLAYAKFGAQKAESAGEGAETPVVDSSPWTPAMFDNEAVEKQIGKPRDGARTEAVAHRPGCGRDPSSDVRIAASDGEAADVLGAVHGTARSHVRAM